MPSCFAPRPRRCGRSPPTPPTSARRLDSLPSCIPGGRRWSIILICTASCPGAACPPMAPVGSPAAPASSCPSGCSRACFAGCCSRRFRTRSTRGNSASPGPSRPWADRQAFAGHLTPARQTDWVVYAKPPFAGPAQVLDYVGRYTHRIAISNHRVLDMEDGHVRFRHKNYRAKAPTPHATMTLTAREFIRRFLLHVLPPGFHRIRYYGFLGNRHRTEKLARCRRLLDTDATPPAPTEGPREPTIATATRPSPAAPYAAVPSVTAGT